MESENNQSQQIQPIGPKSLTPDFVLQALSQHNYLPMQKESKEELPPIFVSNSFTPDVVKSLVAKSNQRTDGYDTVEYRLTRFNGVSRILSIPHPAAYAELVNCIHNNWKTINYIAVNDNSIIRPRQHDDGRIIIMDYESSVYKTRRELQARFTRRFQVHTDISNCYPTIYSHSVPWALVGFSAAKAGKNDKNEWFNQLDKNVRQLKRNETQGIAIGPATSNIISEIILARVDEKLVKKQFSFIRFIDDYTAYCSTEEEGQDFIRVLQNELQEYKLLLNIKKTEILELPLPLESDWITELTLRLPKTDGTKLSRHEALRYLNFAVNLAKQSPDGSVLKYAVKSILNQPLEPSAQVDILQYALQLSYHHPVLIPLLDSILEEVINSADFDPSNYLQELAYQNAQFHRSDGMVWTLYYLNKFNFEIRDTTVDTIIDTQDSLSLLMLYLSKNKEHQSKVIHEMSLIVDSGDHYEIDQHWMLLYQLYRDGKIKNPYSNDGTFKILRDHNVCFIDPKTMEPNK
jgi:hypothetical protein